MFYIGEPNIGNAFLANFLEHNQINENVLLFVEYFQLKIFYTRKLFYMSPNTA